MSTDYTSFPPRSVSICGPLEALNECSHYQADCKSNCWAKYNQNCDIQKCFDQCSDTTDTCNTTVAKISTANDEKLQRTMSCLDYTVDLGTKPSPYNTSYGLYNPGPNPKK
jgi:hypothetical protein